VASCIGTSASLSVTATGSNLTYQWYKAGIAITGATNSTLNISNLQTSDANTYYVVITGACGNATSTSATIAVNTPSTITVQPVSSVVICAGTSTTLSVTALGTNLLYQWFNDVGAIPGATSNNYTATTADNYYVIVRGTCNSVSSSKSNVTVTTATAITSQPVNVSSCVGTSASLSVTAVGSNLTYQWYKAGTAISGATNSILNISNIQTGNAGTYNVIVTGACGTIASNVVSIIVGTPTSITLQPTATSIICNGSSTVLSVTALGTNLTYQWYNDAGVITGATSSNYTATSANNYYVIVRGACNNITSSKASVFVNDVTVITAQPTAVSACIGSSISMSVSATGDNLMYQWFKDGNILTGANNAVLTISNVQTTHTGNYSVQVTGSCGIVTSANALATINTPAIITVQPPSLVTICAGTSTTLNVTALGTNLTYQWFNDQGAITGATTNSYIATTENNYYAKVSGECNNITSAKSAVLVRALPQGSLTGSTICAGAEGQLLFTSTSTGTGPFTIVYTDGVTQYTKSSVISGVWFNTTNLSTTTNYTLVSVQDAIGCIRSDNFNGNTTSVIVNQLPTITSNPIDVVSDEGKNVTFTVAATGTAVKYQWQLSSDMGVTYSNIFNSGLYSGANTNTLTISNIVLRMNGFSYRCVVSGTCNPAVSSNAALLTITTPLASFSVDNANQCLSNNSFKFTNTSNTNVGTLYYSWNFGDGVGTSTVINPTYTYKNPGTYFVKLVSVTNSGVKDSAMKTIVVYPKPNPSFTINSKEQCLLNNSFEFTNTTVVSAAPIFGFKWNFDNGTVSSNISPVKSFTAPGIYNVKLVATTFYGCTDSTTQQVIVDSMPLVNLITSNGTILCNGSTLTIAATGGQSYQWYKDGTIIPNQTASNLVLNASGLYSVKTTNSMGCISQNNVSTNISLVSKPIANFSYNTYCIQVPATFTSLSTVNNSGIVNYNWSDNQGNISNSLSPTFTYNTAGIVSMKLKVIPQACPLLTDSLVQTIQIETPTKPVRMGVIDIAKGEDVVLRARTFGTSYLWSPATGLNNPNIMYPTANLTAEQTYNINITAKSGCLTVDTLQVRVFDNYEVFVPNVFTPNGDGTNDILKMNLVGIKEIKFFRIYNRAGLKVFESINNSTDGWDGKYNGVLQPLDTYMWIVEGINKFGTPIRQRGTTTLLR